MANEIDTENGVYSVTRTKRRRFCGARGGATSRASPLLPPDAWSGGARTEEEAREAAERAAGMPLRPIDGRWAGAWVRLRAGLPPFVRRAPRIVKGDRPPAPRSARAILEVGEGATLEEVKAAFRRKALEHHPDRGGDPERFIAVKRAYDSLVRRLARRR